MAGQIYLLNATAIGPFRRGLSCPYVPAQALQELGDARSWGLKETLWYGGAIALTILAAPLSYFSHCPMPLMFAFAFGAIAVGLMEDAAET